MLRFTRKNEFNSNPNCKHAATRPMYKLVLSDIKKTFTGELNYQKYTKSMFTKPKCFTLKCYAHRVRISNFTYSMIEYFGEIETEF